MPPPYIDCCISPEFIIPMPNIGRWCVVMVMGELGIGLARAEDWLAFWKLAKSSAEKCACDGEADWARR